MFADDAVVYTSHRDFEICLDRINELINVLSIWMSKNRLTVNTTKTKIMLFSNRNIPHLPNVYFNDAVIEWVHSIKYLGMTIDSKLLFAEHIGQVHRKLSGILGLFYSMHNYMPRSTMMTLYYSLVYSKVCQNIIIWGAAAKCHTNKLDTALNKILRVILNVKFSINRIPLTATNSMYKDLKLLKFHDIYRFFLLKFIHNALYKNPDIFDKYFSIYMPNHYYPTRHNRINLPNVRLDVGIRSTVFQACKLMNEMDDRFLEPQSAYTLKKNFKELCLEKHELI